jgi:hypothetical protein
MRSRRSYFASARPLSRFTRRETARVAMVPGYHESRGRAMPRPHGYNLGLAPVTVSRRSWCVRFAYRESYHVCRAPAGADPVISEGTLNTLTQPA